jgi:hypothetical protein
MTYTGLTAGNAPTLSQRQKEDLKRILAEDEQVTRLDPRQSQRGQVFESPHVVGNVRQRQEAAEAAARAKAEAEAKHKFDSYGQPRHVGVPVFTSAEERSAYFAAAHVAEVKQAAEWQAEHDREMAERQRRQCSVEEVHKRNAARIEINLSLGQFQATPAERQKVFEAAKRKFAETLPTGEQALSILFALRDAVGSTPDWARDLPRF